MTEQPKPWRDMTDAEKVARLVEHEGKAIQFWDKYSNEGWRDVKPSWGDSSAYRVKPEPKVETWIVQGNFNERFGWSFNPESHENDTHQITLTIIDGKVQREAIVERIEK